MGGLVRPEPVGDAREPSPARTRRGITAPSARCSERPARGLSRAARYVPADFPPTPVRPLVLFFLALSALLAPPAAAQAGFSLFNDRNHPEIEWLTVETEHFEITYPERLSGIEAEAAAIAEASYDALTVNLGDSLAVAFPGKMRIYLSDEDEIANGFAFDIGSGYTAIWVHVNEFAEVWTGDVKWLRKVLAHEIAHLVHYRAVRGNVGLAQNLLADAMPSFWAEGVAQYQTERWDAQRGERWLRTAAFEDRLSYADGSSVQNGRLRYAVGNAQVRYLAQTYGDSTLSKILAHREPAVFGLARVNDFETAFRDVMKRPFSDFQEEWRKHVNVYYNTLAGQHERLDSLGVEPLALPGQVVYDVQFSPDTSRVAALVLTSLARPVRRLYRMNNPGAADSTARRRSDLKVLAEGDLVGPFAWHPAGTHVAVRRERRGAAGSIVGDVVEVDMQGRERRLTTGRRASAPTYAPDGARIAFVGVNGPGANVWILDRAGGAERALTRFPDDTQITSLRWSPDGATVAAAVFTADRRRQILLLDVETGDAVPLATADGDAWARDDRMPVWNAAGDSLAYTALDDGAPNVWVGGVRGSGLGVREMLSEADIQNGPVPSRKSDGLGAPMAPPTSDSTTVPSATPIPNPQSPTPAQPSRVSFLFTGATVHDWLPPSEGFPAGRFVLVSSETKRRDRVFVVDARRRPTVPVPDTPRVPPAYAAWTTHRPPTLIPDEIAPDASLIQTAPRRYNSWTNITHGLTLPFPYGDPGEDGELFTSDDDWGVFATTLWMEPLGKHVFLGLAGVSVTRPVDKSFWLLSYTNRQFAPTLGLDLYRYPSPSRFYGSSVLVENLTGGDVSATLPLDVLEKPFTTLLAGARLRYAYADPIALDRFDDLADVGDGLALPEAGTRFDVQLGLAYKFQRPYRYNTVAPLDGTGARLRVNVGIPTLGADDAFVRPDLLAYHTTGEILGGRLFFKGRATATFGDALAQDYVGLARYDDLELEVPFVGALALDDSERVRGTRRYAVGTRALFGSAEYRLPILFDLNTTLLGAVRLGGVAPALFLDSGVVWTGSDLGGGIRRTGLGGELKNEVSVLGFRFAHALGVAAPAGRLDELWGGDTDDLEVYYRLQAAVPF